MVWEYENELRKTNWKKKNDSCPESDLVPGWSLDRKKFSRLDFRSKFTDKTYSYPFSFPTSSSKEMNRLKMLKK